VIRLERRRAVLGGGLRLCANLRGGWLTINVQPRLAYRWGHRRVARGWYELGFWFGMALWIKRSVRPRYARRSL
jgi:hypothetical protein